MRPATAILTGIIIACLWSIPVAARRQSTISRNLKPASYTPAPEPVHKADTINASQLCGILLSGYDKPINASRETFFITNRTDSVLSSLTIMFTYSDMTGRLLHKATHSIPCDIPPGETRSVSVPAWDRQHSFYYHKSAVPRRKSTPFAVTHTIIRATTGH